MALLYNSGIPALLLSDCSLEKSPLTCHLASILHLLDVAAVILGILFMFVVIIAVFFCQRRSADQKDLL